MNARTTLLSLLAASMLAYPLGGAAQDSSSVAYEYKGPGLIVAVPLLDLGLSKKPKEAEWPTIREAASVTGAVKIRDALAETGIFADALVVTTQDEARANGSADLFLSGTIKKLNGEDLHIKVELIDIAGNKWNLSGRKQGQGKRKVSTVIKHRATDEWYDSSPSANKDPFEALYVKIADVVAKAVVREGERHAKNEAKNAKLIEKGRANKVKDSDLDKLVKIRQLQFAGVLSPELYGDAISKKKNKWKLAYSPATDTEEWARVQAIKSVDDTYLQTSMRDYRKTAAAIEKIYAGWQREAYPIAKRVRKERFSNPKKLFTELAPGFLETLAGAGCLSEDEISALKKIVCGALVVDGVMRIWTNVAETKEEQKQLHTQLSKLSSLPGDVMVARIVSMQGRQQKLSGTAAEQQERWSAIMREIYVSSVDPSRVVIKVG